MVVMSEFSQSFQTRLLPLLDCLLYPSESDLPIDFFCYNYSAGTPLTTQSLQLLFGMEFDSIVREREPSTFWSLVTTMQDWYAEEEQDRTNRFIEIKQMIEANLIHIQYFEVGEIEVGLYLIGQAQDQIIGIKTMAVRT